MRHGYSLILAASNDEPEREIAAVEMLRSKRVDAVIVTSSWVGALHQERLGAAGVPVILLNSHSQQQAPHTFSVRVDDRHGGCLATAHLIDLGHRRIAHVAGPAGHSPSAGRLDGYLAALAEARLPFDPALVIPGDGRFGGGEAALTALRDLTPRPTAVFCYNDMTAIGLLRAARQAGLRIPDDLAVVGFDDIPIAAYVSPALTTVAQPKFELGQRAMAMAMALMGGETGAVGDLILPGRLVIRESTGAPLNPQSAIDNSDGRLTMKGLVLDAKWDPRPDYAVSDWERRTGKVITGSSMWRYPKLEVREKPMPQITKPGQALLEVQACGVCGSDIHFYERDSDGYMYYPGLTKFPVTTGHEFSAKVVEVSKDVDYLKPGTPVTVEEMHWCGYCTPCRNGFPNHCENLEEIGFTVDGAFQQYLVVDAKSCWPVDGILERYGEKLGYDVAAMSEPIVRGIQHHFQPGGRLQAGRLRLRVRRGADRAGRHRALLPGRRSQDRGLRGFAGAPRASQEAGRRRRV